MTAETNTVVDDELEDSWGRREARETLTFSYAAYGLPVELRANDPRLLEAARLSARRYSRCALWPPQQPLCLHLMVNRQLAAPEVPLAWPAQLQHQAVGPWLTINGEPWLQASAHLEHRAAVALVSGSLADQPNLVSRYVYDTIALNMLMRTGLGLLHASCLYRDGTALLLSAAHNTGKSTTALHLALNGWGLVSDGMTYVRVTGEQIELLGYPVGEAKLRFDVLDQFPQLAALGQTTRVREHTKMVFDLRQALPGVVTEDAIRPERIVLCHLERRGELNSTAQPIGWSTLFPTLWSESTFLDDAAILHSDRLALEALLTRTCCYNLSLGMNVGSTLDLLSALCAGS